MYLLLSLTSSIPIIHIASEHHQDFENTLHIALPVLNSYYSLGIQQQALMHKGPIHLYPFSLPLYEQRRHQYSCYLVPDIIALLVLYFHNSEISSCIINSFVGGMIPNLRKTRLKSSQAAKLHDEHPR